MSQVTPEADSNPGRSLPLSASTALVLAVVLSLGLFWLTSSGESPVGSVLDLEPGEIAGLAGDDGEVPETTVAPEPAPVTRDEMAEADGEEPAVLAVPPTTVAAAETFAGLGGGDAARSAAFSVLAMASDITNMGPTEVGFVTNFPEVAYEWERVEIGVSGGFDVAWLGELNGMLVAVSPTWNEEVGGTNGQRLVSSISTDGLDWQVGSEYELPESMWVSRVVSDGAQVYAFADSWDEVTRTNQTFLFRSADGVSWSEATLDFGAEADEHVYMQNAAAGPAGLVLAVSFESYPEEEPALLDFGDVQVELDHRAGAYALVDADTGDVLLSGSIDEIYNWGRDGQTIYDPESGELLTTVPWEIWERAFSQFYEGYGGGSPLPVPINPVEPEGPPVITIEYDGLVIVVDDYAYEFSVTDAETGEELAAGSLEYVYQGPPPRFIDPDTGEVLLSVTWDEWHRAEEESYKHFESRHYEYSSRTELLTSADGVDWESTEIPTRQGAHVSYIVPTEDGFVAMVSSYSEFGDQRSVWTLDDGIWTNEEAEVSDLWLYQVARSPSGFIGVGEGPGGPALWASSDGVNWASEFAIVPQNDGSYVSMTSVAADENGTVAALARREKWSEYKPLVIEKDGYTLTFEDGDVALRVVDASGAEVLALSWYASEDGSAEDVVTWDDGVTYFDLGNGDVIAIPDEEAYAAMESRWAHQGETGLSVFLRNGSTWAEAIVEVEGGFSGGSQLHLIDGRIIIGGTYWEGGGERYHSEVMEGGTFVIIVGTPIGG